MTPPELRPLSTGEIFKQAFATYGARWLVLSAIVACDVVPMMLIQSAGFGGLNALLAQVNAVPGGDFAARQRILAAGWQSIDAGGVFSALLAAPLVFDPLMRSALVGVTAAGLDGVPLSLGAAWRLTSSRWLAQAVTTFVASLLAGVAGVLLILACLVVVAGFMLAGGGTQSAGGAILGFVAIAAGLVVLAVAGALFNVAVLGANVSIVIDEPNPVLALGHAWRRTFDRALRRRALALGCVLLAFQLVGEAIIVTLGALVGGLLHLTWPSLVIGVAGSIVLIAVSLIAVLLYARDVRAGSEGTELLGFVQAPDANPGGDVDAADRALIERYLARRGGLDPQAARTIGAALARRIRPKLRASFDYLDDDDLLEHVARSRS